MGCLALTVFGSCCGGRKCIRETQAASDAKGQGQNDLVSPELLAAVILLCVKSQLGSAASAAGRRHWDQSDKSFAPRVTGACLLAKKDVTAFLSCFACGSHLAARGSFHKEVTRRPLAPGSAKPHLPARSLSRAFASPMAVGNSRERLVVRTLAVIIESSTGRTVPMILELLSCVGRAVVKNAPKLLLKCLPFGEALYDIASDTLEEWKSRRSAVDRRAELEALRRQIRVRFAGKHRPLPTPLHRLSCRLPWPTTWSGYRGSSAGPYRVPKIRVGAQPLPPCRSTNPMTS